MLLSVNLLFAQDVELIKPIIESPAMNLNQMKSFVNQQNFKNWGIQKLGLDSVMMSLTGDSVLVCICDTGKPLHPDLKDRIFKSENFTTDNSVDDKNGHSTHVAGIINEIAPDSKLLFAKVLSDSGFGSNHGVASGISWCVNQGAQIINLSLSGKNPSNQIKESIDFATSQKVLLVAAAGNSGQSETNNTMGYPARYTETLAIGSINENLKVSSFSSSGEEGDVVAPGEKVLSTWKDGNYVLLSGTSMSAPYVAGVAALHYEKHKTNTGVELLFEVGSKDILPVGFDNISFWGYITPPNIFRDSTSNELPPDESEEPVSRWGRYDLIIFIAAVIVALALIFWNYKNK